MGSISKELNQLETSQNGNALRKVELYTAQFRTRKEAQIQNKIKDKENSKNEVKVIKINTKHPKTEIKPKSK